MLDLLANQSVKDIILNRLEELKKALPEEAKKIVLAAAKALIEKGKLTKEDLKLLLADVKDDSLDEIKLVLNEIIDDLADLAKVKLDELIKKI